MPDPREVIVNPALLRELQVPGNRRLVPVTVWVDEAELETWKAVEQAYGEGKIGLQDEFRDFPPTEGPAQGPFNPRGESPDIENRPHFDPPPVDSIRCPASDRVGSGRRGGRGGAPVPAPRVPGR